MAQNKQLSERAGSFAHGGYNKMAGKGSSGPQKPGVSSQEGKGGEKFAKGGNTKMFGKQKSTPAKKC